MTAGYKQMTEAQSAKVCKLSQREGNPVFSPSRLLAAICKVAPQFKVLWIALEQMSHVQLDKALLCGLDITCRSALC